MSDSATHELQTDQASREASGAHPYGRYLEDFEVGAVYKHWPAKTITEADDHLFCLLTMNHHPLHLNDVYAKRSQHGRNVVVGPLVYSIMLGMSVSDVSGKAIANLATEELSHPAPVFHGDTLFVESEVLEVRPSSSKHDQPISAGGHELASEVGERVRSIISAAEAAANALRHEADQTAAVRRRLGEEEARRIIEDAKADADAYLAERIRRIEELSDTVVERAETIVARLDRAEEVRQQLQSLADALGESAERLANEVRVGTPPPTVRSPSSPPRVPAPPAAPP